MFLLYVFTVLILLLSATHVNVQVQAQQVTEIEKIPKACRSPRDGAACPPRTDLSARAASINADKIVGYSASV